MNELIRDLIEISKSKEMSQESIAREIGVSLQTVNRWFKGKFEPTSLAVPAIEAFIKKHR